MKIWVDHAIWKSGKKQTFLYIHHTTKIQNASIYDDRLDAIPNLYKVQHRKKRSFVQMLKAILWSDNFFCSEDLPVAHMHILLQKNENMIRIYNANIIKDALCILHLLLFYFFGIEYLHTTQNTRAGHVLHTTTSHITTLKTVDFWWCSW